MTEPMEPQTPDDEDPTMTAECAQRQWHIRCAGRFSAPWETANCRSARSSTDRHLAEQHLAAPRAVAQQEHRDLAQRANRIYTGSATAKVARTDRHDAYCAVSDLPRRPVSGRLSKSRVFLGVDGRRCRKARAMSLNALYESRLAAEGLAADAYQQAVVDAFQRVMDASRVSRARRAGAAGSHVPRRRHASLCLLGRCRARQTWLMDLFHDNLHGLPKARFHFHRFMQLVHSELGSIKGRANPLQIVADAWPVSGGCCAWMSFTWWISATL